MITGMEGGCDCGKVRYRLKAEPIFINCCHCRLCQRQTGSAFAVNLLIEADNVELLGEKPVATHVPTPSGGGQGIVHCAHCGTTVWSVYGAAGDKVRFVKGGTLDDPSVVVPRAHIFVGSKAPWVQIPEGAAQFPGFYSGRDLVPAFGQESADRWRAALSR